MQSGNNVDLSIVTITYNERENIRLLLEDINEIFSKEKIKGEIIIVDDCSPDGTADEIKKLAKKYSTIKLIVRKGKLGIASAYRDGIDAAKGNIIMPLDADFSHPPFRIPALYKAASGGNIAFGSRYIGEKIFETDFPHYVGTTLINKWTKLILKTGLNDNTNGFWAAPSEMLRKIRTYTGEKGIDPFNYVLSGIAIAGAAKRLGLPVVEVETAYKRRRYGETKIPFFSGLKIVLGDMWLVLKLRRMLK